MTHILLERFTDLALADLTIPYKHPYTSSVEPSIFTNLSSKYTLEASAIAIFFSEMGLCLSEHYMFEYKGNSISPYQLYLFIYYCLIKYIIKCTKSPKNLKGRACVRGGRGGRCARRGISQKTRTGTVRNKPPARVGTARDL